MRFLIMLLSAVIALPAGVVLYFTRRTAGDRRQAVFDRADVPDPLPNGSYRGSVQGYERLAAAWYGKRFEAAAGAGTNLVRGAGGNIQEKAPYRTYPDRSLQDPEREVLRVDYNIPQNP